jgi:competence protein ComEA
MVNRQDILEKINENKILIIEILVLFITVAMLVIVFMKKEESTLPSTSVTSSRYNDQTSRNSRTSETPQIYVDIKGEVKKPNIYKMSESYRVKDAIEMAGGFTENADKNQVNLSQKVVDEMVIFVPKTGELAIPNTVEEQKKINLNRATEEELQEITGVGEMKAKSIVEYREKVGKFSKIEDLKKVSGFGEKSFEKIKEEITVSG